MPVLEQHIVYMFGEFSTDCLWVVKSGEMPVA